MDKLSTVLPPDQIIQCDCGCKAFFDWGIKIGSVNDFGPSPRNKEWASTDNVQICVSCLKPSVVYQGTIYDASEYISAEQVQDLIEKGQARHHAMPPRRMDP
jgi:hypothetical protein